MRCLILVLTTLSWVRAAETITLREAVHLALRQHPEVEIERATLAQVEALARAARGAFDPVVQLQSNARSSTNPVASILDAPNGRLSELAIGQSAQLAWQIPSLGARLTTRFENQRLRTNNPFVNLNPNNSPRWSIDLTLPLLRGRRVDDARQTLRVRWKQAGLSTIEAEGRLAAIVAAAESAFHELREALADESVLLRQKTSAERILDSTTRLVERGELARAEKETALAEVAAASQLLVQARQRVRAARLQLAVAIGTDPALAPDWVVSELAQESFTSSREELLATAMARRTELRALLYRRQIASIEAEHARDALRPRLDLQMGTTLQGLAGRPATVPDILGGNSDVLPAFVGGFGQAVRGFRQFPVWQTSLVWERPIHNREAIERVTASAQQQRRVAAEERILRSRVTAEVLTAVDAWQTAQERIQQIESMRQHALARLNSEVRLFEAGESRLADLELRSRELLRAEQYFNAARRSAGDAATALRRATGQLLSAWGIDSAESHLRM